MEFEHGQLNSLIVSGAGKDVDLLSVDIGM